MFHRKDIVFLNLISRYMSSASEQFLRSKYIADIGKVKFCISKSFIQCNASSCCVHITGGVKIYSYMCVSQLVSVPPLCV